MNPIAIAMILGIGGTSVIHLSKGFMGYALAQKGKGSGGKKTLGFMYTIGVFMNFTNPLWVIAANRFAPTPYYTSMYGLGLIPLLIFSRIFLGHGFTKWEFLGILSIIIGTLFLGYYQVQSGIRSLYNPNPRGLIVLSLVWFVGSPLLLVGARGITVKFQEVLFGLAAGGMAALDALLKGVAQAGPTGSSYVPSTNLGWGIFLASFLGAAGAFFLIQWSYLRHCRPSMMGSVYDVSYTALPLIVLTFMTGTGVLNQIAIGGLIFLSIGILLPLFFHSSDLKPHIPEVL